MMLFSVLALVFLTLIATEQVLDSTPSRFAYVGTYSEPAGTGKGIYVYKIEECGNWTLVQTVETTSPSFLVLNAKKDRLYAVNELDQTPEINGTLSSFSVDPDNGKLSLLSSVSTGGVAPCHLCLDDDQEHVFVANYKDSISVFKIDDDGAAKTQTDFLRFYGSGPNKERQTSPHPHFVGFDKDGDSKLVQVIDLGRDRIDFFSFDDDEGTLKREPRTTYKSNGGAGPRHSVINSDLYVANELDSTVSVFKYEAEKEEKEPVQTVAAAPNDWNKPNYPSEIMLHPSEKFLYVSNRGHDSIAIFKIDESTGLLTSLGHRKTNGSYPRHFQIDGYYLYVGNQKSNSITVFKIDCKSGELTDTQKSITVPSPACIVFY